jgi:DNA helicase-2/ATP-dependent DNA helicase PcrA
MNKNKLIIAAAGSGKTTYLINEAMKFKNQKVLITTYTEANEEEIKKKFIKKYKCIPGHIMVQTWFSFLLQHGVKPYQGSFNEILFNKNTTGMILCNGDEGKFPVKVGGKTIYVPIKEETDFKRHYFTDSLKIYSDRLPKFVVKSNTATNGEIINRISRIYKHIFVDEVQDLAGYDLDILKLFFQTQSSVLLVGDPRQVTYLTHHENKYGKYKNGKIKEFVTGECKNPITYIIDESTLNTSHRNNKAICDFSSKLYNEIEFKPISPCECDECRNYEMDSEGIFLVRPGDVENYLFNFNPIQLRWDIRKQVNPGYTVYNFGESKGKSFDRVLIYPTDDMEKWVYSNATDLAYSTKAKFYVAITRARFSVGIVSNFQDGAKLDGAQLYYPD